MAQKTDSDLLIQKEVIKSEGTNGANTKTRIGQMFEDIIDSKVNNDDIVDEDDMASDSAVKVPSQQSVKAYVDGAIVGGSVDTTPTEDSTNAVQSGGVFDELTLKAPLHSPAFTGTATGLTKAMVGLSDVDNTSNATERAATATLTNKTMSGDDNTFSNIPASAILVGDTEEFDPDLYALLASPTFTGTVTTPAIKITGGTPGAGKLLQSDADGDATWETVSVGGTGLATRRSTKFELFADFISVPIQSSSAAGGSDDFCSYISGAGAGTSSYATSPVGNRPGVIALSAGTTNTGVNSIFAGSGLKAGEGAWIIETDVRVPTLSTISERFVIKVGLFNEITAIDETDAISFIYDEGGVSTGSAASANWQICTANSSTRTYTTSSVAVGANTWHKLKIEINAAGTSVEFFVDGASVGTHATNIPTGARNVTMAAGIFKSIGTTDRSFHMDYYSAELTFTTPR